MPHAYSGMRHWKPGMYSGTRRRLCWTELCDLVEIWLFTVKCFVFKWPWPWWELLEVVWMCTVAGGVTESVQRGGKFPVPLHFCIFFFPKSEKYPILNPKKRRKLLIYMLHLSALSSLITSFRFPNQRSQMFMLQPVGYYYVLTVCQCCWTQTQSCTDWFNKVYKTQQKVPGLSPPVVSCSLEQDSCNRIITTTTSERIGVQEHSSSSSSMSPLLNATSVYIYHTLKKDESNNTKKKT